MDAYKRGAFLEKADRFNKDKPSDVPGTNIVHNLFLTHFNLDCEIGPGAYSTDSKTNTKPTTASGPKHSATERYAALQRKLEDLERIHADGKKSVSNMRVHVLRNYCRLLTL